jgi:hypothetical protein
VAGFLQIRRLEGSGVTFDEFMELAGDGELLH